MSQSPDVSTKVLSEGRKRLGFDQAWMPDSDFKCPGCGLSSFPDFRFLGFPKASGLWLKVIAGS